MLKIGFILLKVEAEVSDVVMTIVQNKVDLIDDSVVTRWARLF